MVGTGRRGRGGVIWNTDQNTGMPVESRGQGHCLVMLADAPLFPIIEPKTGKTKGPPLGLKLGAHTHSIAIAWNAVKINSWKTRLGPRGLTRRLAEE